MKFAWSPHGDYPREKHSGRHDCSTSERFFFILFNDRLFLTSYLCWIGAAQHSGVTPSHSGAESRETGQNVKTFFKLHETWYTGVFQFAYYGSKVIIKKIKIANKIWRAKKIKSFENYSICVKLRIQMLSTMLIRIQKLNFQKQLSNWHNLYIRIYLIYEI